MLSFSRFFPLLAIGVAILAWYNPAPLIGWKEAIIPLLTLIMFAMGLSLTWQDFRRIWRKPKAVALGVVLQFVLMPLLAVMIGKSLSLSSELALGLLLVGSCSGGTASNVMTFLAKGDLALSVSMTLFSTLWGVVLTPYLVWLFAKTNIQIDPLLMMFSIFKIVIAPVALGVLCNKFIPKLGKSLQMFLPDIASAGIVMIIAIVVALNANNLSSVGMILVCAVILHNLLGLLLGYIAAKLIGLTEVQARTISIEVGMQNSGLAVALSLQFFTPIVALAGALFSIWHNISGSLLASYWAWNMNKKVRQLREKNK